MPFGGSAPSPTYGKCPTAHTSFGVGWLLIQYTALNSALETALKAREMRQLRQFRCSGKFLKQTQTLLCVPEPKSKFVNGKWVIFDNVPLLVSLPGFFSFSFLRQPWRLGSAWTGRGEFNMKRWWWSSNTENTKLSVPHHCYEPDGAHCSLRFSSGRLWDVYKTTERPSSQ